MTQDVVRREPDDDSISEPDPPEHDRTDELVGAAAVGIGGAALGGAAGSTSGPARALLGAAIGGLAGAAAGAATGAAVDLPGASDVHGVGAGPLTDVDAPLDHAAEIDSADTLDPA